MRVHKLVLGAVFSAAVWPGAFLRAQVAHVPQGFVEGNTFVDGFLVAGNPNSPSDPCGTQFDFVQATRTASESRVCH